MKKKKKRLTKIKKRYTTIVGDAAKAGEKTQETASEIYEKLKEIPQMPWKQLPVIGWVYIAVMVAVVVVCLVVIRPAIG